MSRTLEALDSRSAAAATFSITETRKTPHSPKRLPVKLSDIPEFAASDDPDQQIALALLDANAMSGLSFSQKKRFFIYYCWQHETDPKKHADLFGLSYNEKMYAVEDVSNNMGERYERFVRLVGIAKNVKEKTGHMPALNEFDYWVYEVWQESAEHHKTLALRIPQEFQFDNLKAGEKIKKISAATRKLFRYGVISSDFVERRLELRRKRIKEIVNRNGEVPTVATLMNMFQVDRIAISHDLASLRREKAIPKGKKFRSEKEQEALANRIKRVIRNLERDGRKYAEGHIGPAEIAKRLKMGPDSVKMFIFRYGEKFDIPKRKDSMGGRRALGEVYKTRIRQAVVQNPDLLPSELLNLLKNNDPEFPFAEITVERVRRQVIREQKAALEEAVLQEV